MFDRIDFRETPEAYESDFLKFAKHTDIFISCHYWDPKAPVYLELEDFIKYHLPIKMIGDITCDICGSIKSTIRSTTHAEPYYDFNPSTLEEEPPFSSRDNITVMAVDTCPNALAIDASEYFGEMLIEYVFKPLLSNDGDASEIIRKATIVKDGRLTEQFSYLEDFTKEI
jgi:alanine dehydrogenase